MSEGTCLFMHRPVQRRVSAEADGRPARAGREKIYLLCSIFYILRRHMNGNEDGGICDH